MLGNNYKVYPEEIGIKNHYKLIIDDGYNKLDISQVGFGFSQVVPIITLVLLSKG